MTKKIKNKMELYTPNRKSIKDKRRRETWAVFSYFEVNTGDEYRKVFTSVPYTSKEEMEKLAPREIID